MFPTSDPRLRRAFDQLHTQFETAQSRTQESLFSFTQSYVAPCLASTAQALQAVCPCCPCLAGLEDEWRSSRRGRRFGHGVGRDRAEASFDFYDDWDDDAPGFIDGDEQQFEIGAGGEHEPLLSGGGRQMTYGSRKASSRKLKDDLVPSGADDHIIHSSSYFGFLESIPFRWGSRGLRYQPSIADLQDHPSQGTKGKGKGKGKGKIKGNSEESTQGHPNDEEDEDDEDIDNYDDYNDYDDIGIKTRIRKQRVKLKSKTKASVKGHTRKRSDTQTSGLSGHTTDSMSSRGDIFPSEDEMDDAVPIDDDAFILDNKSGLGFDTLESTKRYGQRSTSVLSLLTVSSRDSGGSTKGSTKSSMKKKKLKQPPIEGVQMSTVKDSLDYRQDDATPMIEEYTILSPLIPSDPIPPPVSSSVQQQQQQQQQPYSQVSTPTIEEEEDIFEQPTTSSTLPTLPTLSTSPSSLISSRSFNAAALPKFT